MSHNIDYELDTSGLVCPLPLLKTKQFLRQLTAGQVLRVISTDPSSVLDFKVFTSTTKHILIESKQQQNQYVFLIQKVGS